MTTAALLQSTSVVADTVVSSAFTMEGVPGGVFDATPTLTVVSVFSMPGIGTPTWITEYRQILGASLNAPGVGTPALVGETIVTAAIPAALSSVGLATTNFFTTVGSGFRPVDLSSVSVGVASFRTDSTYPPVPVIPHFPRIRYISGTAIAVVPVETVTQPGFDVIDVVLVNSDDNYAPVVEDPTHPTRKKIRIVEGQ